MSPNTASKPTELPPAASAAVIPVASGGLVIKTVDLYLQTIGPKVGRLLAKFPSTGTYTLCQTQAPQGRWVANPPCQTVNITAGASVDAGTFIDHEAQVPSQ